MVHRFWCAAVVTVVVLIECAVIAVNGGRCPLTDWAAHFTADRAYNFDIYLPVWLAHYNKLVFGVLFLSGELLVIVSWFLQASTRNKLR
jgi:hypothetical protein